MNFKKATALGLSVLTAATLLPGCASTKSKYTEFTMFIAMPGDEINSDNEIRQLIAEKTGCTLTETWLTGNTDKEAVSAIIASGKYTDFINGGEGMSLLYDEGCLVAWDDYIDKYPNIKEMYTDEEWEMFRQKDGHIYWANVFQNTYGEPKTAIHNDEAFWIQVRVLEEAGYPKIETLDEYFDVITKYLENHKDEGLTGYTMLCEDWRYFCIENAPEFLDGYPNDGSVIVDIPNMKLVDYNTTPTAKMYFNKLNEEFKAGIIDKEFATQTYDEYIAKLSTGNVLGMCDQWWDFSGSIKDSYVTNGLDAKGCDYVPLGLVAKKGMDQQWHTYGDTLNASSGVAITKDCKDVDKAFQFMNDLLNQDVHDLRFWGVKDVDYKVDSDGMYYRTDEMRKNCNTASYKASHLCVYSYMPQWGGTSRDGKNAMTPSEQVSEFQNDLSEPLLNCFKAYGASTYTEFLGSAKKPLHSWFPMYSYSNNMNTSTEGGTAWIKMGECKHKWLPKVVMEDDFEATWDEYMDAYSECKPEDFLKEMQVEFERRAALDK